MASGGDSKSNNNAAIADMKANGKPFIALGTSSALKLGALKAVFGSQYNILTADVKSGVSDQPIGRAETVLGATNRAERAYALQKQRGFSPKWSIGIENGMIEADLTASNLSGPGSRWVDIAAIVIIKPTLLPSHIEMTTTSPTTGVEYSRQEDVVIIEKFVAWSDTLAIPVEWSNYALANRDVGMTYTPLKDPHSQLTQGKKPRQKFLEEALAKFDRDALMAVHPKRSSPPSADDTNGANGATTTAAAAATATAAKPIAAPPTTK